MSNAIDYGSQVLNWYTCEKFKRNFKVNSPVYHSAFLSKNYDKVLPNESFNYRKTRVKRVGMRNILRVVHDLANTTTCRTLWKAKLRSKTGVLLLKV